MNSLIIGMGIGNLYKDVLTELGHKIVTVDMDPSKGAMFTDLNQALMLDKFDTVHICTPNFTHREIAWQVAKYEPGIVFIEKPGLATSKDWLTMVNAFPNTRFMMVKNNMWRDNIDDLRELTLNSKDVVISWLNQDRVPNPGTWFTTKELAFGGVSRDLTPHLLSLFLALDPDYTQSTETSRMVAQTWKLEDVTNTDYGIVNPNGTYDVDDSCVLEFLSHGRRWSLGAFWRTLSTPDDRSITFFLNDGTLQRFELGLCPESAYKAMIADALANISNNDFWHRQQELDLWIHRKVETLENTVTVHG